MVIYSVSQLNNQAKLAIETKFNKIWVKGEITSVKTYPSGHTYFTIRDSKCELSIVLFNSSVDCLKKGNLVLLSGKLSLYTGKGRYQFIAQNVYPDGDGQLWLKYEELKKGLETEGIFKPEVKKEIPKMPKKIGIITSIKGSVIWDILNFFKLQNLKSNIIICDSLVQGDYAPNELINEIDKLINQKVELIIIARGGGSIDDLWCFNNESLIRKIFNLKIPIISAIGHETDYTLCDFVSDYRAPTPSYAAELIYRNYQSINLDLDYYSENILFNVKNLISKMKEILHLYSFDTSFEKFKNKLLKLNQEVVSCQYDLINKINLLLQNKLIKINFYETQFELNHPKNIMKKGYGIVKSKSGKILNKISKININDNVNILLEDGIANAKINEIKFYDKKK